MTLSFYFDHNVNRDIACGLRRRDIDVVTTEEDGRRTLTDEQLLERATELGRVFVSNDRDLLAIAHRWQRQNRPFPGLVKIRQQDILIGTMIDDLELITKAMEPDEMANRIEFVPFPRARR